MGDVGFAVLESISDKAEAVCNGEYHPQRASLCIPRRCADPAMREDDEAADLSAAV